MTAPFRHPSTIGALLPDVAESLGVRGFLTWAAHAHFKYLPDAHHLFCKCASAAEAYFLRPFTERPGVRFTRAAAILRDVRVLPQHSVAGFSVDFAVHGGARWVAVEIDGMAFHHATAEQVARDYARQRRLVAAGYFVIRFTAQEAFGDAVACWKEIDGILA